MLLPDSDDEASVTSWHSSSSASNNSRSAAARSAGPLSQLRSSVSSPPTAPPPPPPGKYKRRRRVYERIKANARLQSLATVPEGEELRDVHSWFGLKIASVLVGLVICIAGIKEGTNVMRDLIRGGEAGYDTASLKQALKGPKSKTGIFPGQKMVGASSLLVAWYSYSYLLVL